MDDQKKLKIDDRPEIIKNDKPEIIKDKVILDSQLVYVNSFNRLSGSVGTHDFYCDIGLDPTKGFNRCTLLSATISKTYYSLPLGLNSFTLTEGALSAFIELNKGNYSIDAFLSNLETKLNEGSPNGFSYVCSIPDPEVLPDTGKITITVSGNSGVQPSISFGTINQQVISIMMGFDANSTYTFTDDTLESANIVSMNTIDSIKILSNIIENNYSTSASNLVLQGIYSINPFYSNITYQATAPLLYSKKVVNQNAASARFWLLDENDNIINLNGGDIQFDLLFWRE